MSSNVMVYGSNGYTGELIVDKLLEKGIKPVLAGRSEEKIRPQAEKLDLQYKIFALDNRDAIDSQLEDIGVVVHSAGPFSRTAKPMAEACIRTKTHYLDITGEIEVFETIHALDSQAKEAGVMLMPGAGFDVVPSDCLAAHLKRRLPSAANLKMGFRAIGKPSRGTATTMVENVHKGGAVRQDGEITQVPAGWKRMFMDFDDGDAPQGVMLIPWGDVSTAYYSTGIPNIEVYMATPLGLRWMTYFSRYFGGILASGPVQNYLKNRIQAGPKGPSEEERRTGRSYLWGEVWDAEENHAVSTLNTPEGYELTALTSSRIAQKVSEGEAPAGFQTPSMAYGADLILEFDGVERKDMQV